MLQMSTGWLWFLPELGCFGIKMYQQYPRITAGALIFNKKNHILFLKSNKWKGQYGIPAGKVHYGEKVLEGLKREVKEETGLDIYGIRYLLWQEVINQKSFFKKAHFVSINYVCKTNKSEVKLNNEAQSYKWVTAESALKLNLNEPTKELIQYYLRTINQDKIVIKDLEIECIVGIRKKERKEKQKIYITAEVYSNTKKAAKTKDVEDTINYSPIVNNIKNLLIDKKYLLLESMAEDIAKLVLKNKKAKNIRVLIKKPKAIGNGKYVGVEIYRP
jgi:nucleoside triphosphatase